MRKIAKSVAVLALACSSAASAEGGYWGGVAGLMNIDLPHADNPINLGLRGGYVFPTGWGFELEYTDSLVSGEADVFSPEVDVDIRTKAGYVTYRSYGDLYFKGRLGILHEDVTMGRTSRDDSGMSLGVGIGFNYGPNTTLELEYTAIEDDVGFWSGTMMLNF